VAVDDEPMAIDTTTAEMEEKDPIAEKASQLATADLAAIDCHQDFDMMKKAVQETVTSGEKIIFIIDAPTSKTAVLKDLIKKVGVVVETLPAGTAQRWVLCICVARRFDILSVIHSEVTSLFKNNKTYLVQCTASEHQSAKAQPTFRIISQAPACFSEKVPANAALNAVRSKSWENLRQRCLNPQCPLRPKPGPRESQDDHDKTDNEADVPEGAHDLCEVSEDDGDEVGHASEHAEALVPPGKYVKELWTFVRPVEQGVRILRQLCSAETASRCIILTRSAHPGMIVACRQVQLRVVAYVECGIHNWNHGQQLLERMLIKLKHPEAETLVKHVKKRALMQDLQFIYVRAPQEQLIQWRDVKGNDEGGSAWRVGVDHLVENYPEKAAALLSAELEQYGLSLVGTDKGKALRAEKAFREGDCICLATALFFTSQSTLVYFLNECSALSFADRLVKIDGLQDGSETKPLFAILCGAAGYVQHYGNIRRSPNAVLQASPGSGAADGMLSLVARSSNQQGIAKGSLILINYGAQYSMLDEPEAKKQKQLLLNFSPSKESKDTATETPPKVVVKPDDQGAKDTPEKTVPEKTVPPVEAAKPSAPPNEKPTIAAVEVEEQQIKAHEPGEPLILSSNLCDKKVECGFTGSFYIMCTEQSDNGRKIPPWTLLYCVRDGKLSASGQIEYKLTEPYKNQICVYQNKTVGPVKTLSDAISDLGAAKLQSHGGWKSEK
ncbi:unnamed protein product, partial [Durusdinium trenchii]